MTTSSEKIKQYTAGEEIANSVTHGIGIVLGISGLSILLVFSGLAHDGYKIAASIVYCLTMIVLYTNSTLYHGLTNEHAKRIFKVLDHASIYLLIAGTYTPFCLVTLRASSGWVLFGALWCFAAAGIACEAFWVFRPKWVSVIIYLAMGWAAVTVLPQMIRELPRIGLWLLAAGGLSYSFGTIFYVLKKLRWSHTIFHAWVLLGTFLHFFAVLLYVIL